MKNYQSGYIENKGAQIFYHVIGDKEKETIVFLHGNGENHRVFKKQIAHFEEHYHLVLIDSRGHGESINRKKQFNFELMAEDVILVLEELNIPKATILGFSDGANVAIHMARKDPNRIKAVILISGNIYPEGLTARFRLLINVVYFFLLLLKRLKIGNVNRFQRVALMSTHPRLKMEDLELIKTKTLFLAASSDIVKKSHTIEMAQRMPNARYVIIKKTRHLSIYSKTNAYFTQIDKFLEEINEYTNNESDNKIIHG